MNMHRHSPAPHPSHGAPTGPAALPGAPAATSAPWVTVGGGSGSFSLGRPEIEDVSAAWIARSLARLPRWNGQTMRFYSVAQHCLWCAEYVWERTGNPDFALAALLHDAHEAVIGDIPTPVKRHLFALGLPERRYRCFLLAVDQAIHAAFGLAFPLIGGARTVEYADKVAMVTEYRDLFAADAPDLRLGPDHPAPDPRRIDAWDVTPEDGADLWIESARHWLRIAGRTATALDAPGCAGGAASGQPNRCAATGCAGRAASGQPNRCAAPGCAGGAASGEPNRCAAPGCAGGAASGKPDSCAGGAASGQRDAAE